ncbi:unnamed protein product, partial [Prorocentrum cordatum]
MPMSGAEFLSLSSDSRSASSSAEGRHLTDTSPQFHEQLVVPRLVGPPQAAPAEPGAIRSQRTASERQESPSQDSDVFSEELIDPISRWDLELDDDELDDDSELDELDGDELDDEDDRDEDDDDFDDDYGLDPAEEHVISSLPVRALTAMDAAWARKVGDSWSCSICMESFQVGTPVRTLPCFHCFCAACIDEWLRRQGACPICKQRVSDHVDAALHSDRADAESLESDSEESLGRFQRRVGTMV